MLFTIINIHSNWYILQEICDFGLNVVCPTGQTLLGQYQEREGGEDKKVTEWVV